MIFYIIFIHFKNFNILTFILFILYETNYFRIIPESQIFDLTEYFPNHEFIAMIATIWVALKKTTKLVAGLQHNVFKEKLSN
jgi:hypothetical protein